MVVSRRDGFKVLELLTLVVVIGIAGLVALPRVEDALAQGNVTSARTKVTTLYDTARAVASRSGRTATLVISGNEAYVVASPQQPRNSGSLETVSPVENLYTQYRVNIEGSVDSVRVGPAGEDTDSARIVLTKDVHADTIYISRHGQILE
ncbi:MAG: hypothetical protein ACREMX_04265 [Gemmatimonadales bacterium]